jgi:hypothetical protein
VTAAPTAIGHRWVASSSEVPIDHPQRATANPIIRFGEQRTTYYVAIDPATIRCRRCGQPYDAAPGGPCTADLPYGGVVPVPLDDLTPEPALAVSA